MRRRFLRAALLLILSEQLGIITGPARVCENSTGPVVCRTLRRGERYRPPSLPSRPKPLPEPVPREACDTPES